MTGKRNWWRWAVLAILAVGSWAMVRLFHVSTASGDVFPPYSSLRPDPMGTKALHDALASLEGYRVERSFRPWDRLRAGSAAILLLNEPATELRYIQQPEMVDLEERARKGARLIIALKREAAWRFGKPDAVRAKPLEDRWKIRIATTRAEQDGATLALLDRSWKVLREDAGKVLAAERGFGAGAIVIVADSYPFSNEALRRHRDTSLLLDLIGPGKHIIFEESRLGTVLSGSIGQLLRRYQLQGSALVLVLLAILFLWRSSSSLVPAQPHDRTGAIEGRSQSEALTSLIRRTTTPATAAETVLSIWNKSGALLPAVSEARRARVRKELKTASGKDLLAAWKRIHDLLQKRT